MEHGRRYQTIRVGPGKCFVPLDEKQFESMEAAHALIMVLESNRENPPSDVPFPIMRRMCLTSVLETGGGLFSVANMFPNCKRISA